MKHVPVPEEGRTGHSEKFPRVAHTLARAQGCIGFTKHRSIEVFWKPRAKQQVPKSSKG